MSANVHALEPTRTRHLARKPEWDRVEAAVRTIIRWSGDDPEREGLIEMPARVARALEKAFAGYGQDPAAVPRKSFDEIEGYDEMVVLRGVRFESRCEHHLAPIVGRAWVAYAPDGRVVGTSKLARVVENLCKAAAASGAVHRADRQCHRRRTHAARRRRSGQGDTPLYDRTRRPQALRRISSPAAWSGACAIVPSCVRNSSA